MTQTEKIDEKAQNNPQALRKTEIARLLKSVKESGFNSTKDEKVNEKNFRKRSLLDIALSSSSEPKEDDLNTEDLKDTVQENQDFSQENIDLDANPQTLIEKTNNEKIFDEQIIKDQNNLDDNHPQNEEDNSIIEETLEEKLKQAEELGYSNGHKEGLVAGQEQGINQARTEAKEGVDAAIAVFRNAAEAIEKTNPQTLSKLHAAIEFTILELSKDLSGFAIDSFPEKFIQRIKSLAETINKKMNEVTLSINETDLKAIEKFLKENEDLNAINFRVDKNLNRGDISLKADGIKIDDIFESAEIEKSAINRFKKLLIQTNNQNTNEELKTPEENVQNIEDIQNTNEGIKPSEENDFTGEK